MINFNDLPCDIKKMIFKNNREETKKEIIHYKNMYNEVMFEFSDRFNPKIYNGGKDLLKQLKYDIYQKSVPFCMSCECVDGCSDVFCYYNLIDNINPKKIKKLKKYYPQHLVDYWLEDKIPVDLQIKYKLPPIKHRLYYF